MKRTRIFSAIAMALALSACAAVKVTSSDFCSTAKPILVGDDDHLSPETAREIDDHNNTGRKVCGW